MTDDDRALEIARHMHVREGTSPMLGITLVGARMGWAQTAMTVREDMLNGLGTAHGGMIFTLADTAFAYACNARNAASFAYHTSITYLSAARCGDKLVAEAREDAHHGRTGVFTVIVSRGDDAECVAIFRGISRTDGTKVID